MCDIFIRNVAKSNITNIEIIQKDVSKIKKIETFRFALLSGILIYLPDHDVENILKLLYQASNSRSIIILRDGTGTNGDYSINGKFSEALQQEYHAFYRSREHYIDIFKANGFELIADQDMFHETRS